MRNIRVYVVIFLVLLGSIIGGGIVIGRNNQSATLVVFYDQLDQTNTVTTIDGKRPSAQEETSKQATYSIKTGSNIRIVIESPGYETLSTSFSAKANETIHVRADLKPTRTQPLNNLAQLNLATSLPAGTSFRAVYFYNETWAYITLTNPITDPAVVIAQYSPSSDKWKVILGPGTGFDESETGVLPNAVRTYIQNRSGSNN